MSSPLLDPRTPPLIEVVLTVQLEPIAGLNAAQIGRLWTQEYHADFPNVEQHHPVEPNIELEPPAAGTPPFQVKVSTDVIVPRLMFINERGTELIQIQRDRFSFNWKRHQQGEYDYRRYANVRESFAERFATLQSFVEREKLGEVIPSQCQLTYVNHVVYAHVDGAHGHLGALIKPWSSQYTSLAGAELEDARLHIRHVLRDQEGSFLGRLHVNIDPALLPDDKAPIYRVQFMARGHPMGDGISGALAFLDTAHHRLLAAFGEFMSDEVQTQWRAAFGS
jgi:uncharacterized protein (TIGR04255 family)